MRSWITMLPPIMSGISKRPIRNVLVRTAALYSRTATTIILRMLFALAGGSRGTVTERLGRAGDTHEDVVQRGARQLEVAHSAALRQGRQDALRVGTWVKTQLLEFAEVSHLGHARQSAEVRPTLQADAHRVGAVGVLDRIQGTVEDFLPLVNHENEVAHLLGDGHVMRREDDGRPVAAKVEDLLAEDLDVDGVESAERL